MSVVCYQLLAICYQENQLMRLLLRCSGLLVVAVGLNSCGVLGNKEEPEQTDEEREFGPTGIPRHLRAGGPGNPAGTPAGGNNRNPDGLRLTPIEDIVFTSDSENLPELAELLAAPKAKIWEDSYTIARRRSARDGKPLLIWFTNSKFSPNCKALEQELFGREDFGNWATEKLIRLRVDAGYKVIDPNQDLSMAEEQDREIDVQRYARTLEKRYKVSGHPTLVMLNPSGEVIGRWGGYKRGTADFTWGLLKHAEDVSTKAYTSWRTSMEKKGYREWQDRHGRKIFARLIAYTDGELVLVDPDGARFRTHEDKLCDANRAWLDEQKQIRKLP
jgi:thioredoxin-related protein